MNIHRRNKLFPVHRKYHRDPCYLQRKPYGPYTLNQPSVGFKTCNNKILPNQGGIRSSMGMVWRSQVILTLKGWHHPKTFNCLHSCSCFVTRWPTKKSPVPIPYFHSNNSFNIPFPNPLALRNRRHKRGFYEGN